MIIWLYSEGHLKNKSGLIIIRIVSAFDYHMITILWPIADLLLIKNKQTNKQINSNMMIMCLSCYCHNIIILCSYNDDLMIIWISSNDHLMIISGSSDEHLKNILEGTFISILSAVDYHVIMWWSCDNHPMIIIYQLPICYLNKQTNTFEYDYHVIFMRLA